MKKKKHSYLGYFRKHLWGILLAMLLSCFATIGQLASTHFMGILIDELSSNNSSNLTSYAFVMGGIEAVSLLCTLIADKINLRTKVSVIRDLHWNLAGTVANASFQSVAEYDATVLSEKLREGSRFINSVFEIYSCCFSIFTAICALIYSLMLSWELSSLFLLTFFIIMGVQICMIKKLIRKQMKADSASDDSKKLLVQILTAFSAVKSQSLVSGLKKHFESRLDNESTSNAEAESTEITNKYISKQIMGIYLVVFLILGGFLLKSHRLTFGALVEILLYKGKIDGLVPSILNLAKNKARINSSIARMDEVFGAKIKKDFFGTTMLYPASGNISIRNLSAYRGDKKVLDNINLDIKPGQFIGIVGPSGGGKSTLLSVLSRQLTPSSGEIILDGANLWDLNEWSFHKAIKLAPQEPYLFSLSVRQNLLLANPEASDGALWDALKDCAADELVRAKGGLDAVIDEHSLSGGEKQRLALSRLGVCGAKIVLLDESTSALDGNSQKIVLDTIRKAANSGHTMIMVAHRIATLKNSDSILIIEDGKLVESGTFDQLYTTSPKFRHLADLG